MFVCPRRGTAAAVASSIAALTAAATVTAGCEGRPQSTVAGTWTGAAGPALAVLTLNEDGTGRMRVPPLIQEVRVTWTRESTDRVLLHLPGEQVGAQPSARKAGDLPLPATLSDDGRTMTVNSLPVISPLRLTRAGTTEVAR